MNAGIDPGVILREQVCFTENDGGQDNGCGNRDNCCPIVFGQMPPEKNC